jgi:hypothetical protein
MTNRRQWIIWPREDLRPSDIDGQPILIIHPNGKGGDMINRRGVVHVAKHPQDRNRFEVKVEVTVQYDQWHRQFHFDEVWLREEKVRAIYSPGISTGSHLLLKSSEPPEGFVPTPKPPENTDLL